MFTVSNYLSWNFFHFINFSYLDINQAMQKSIKFIHKQFFFVDNHYSKTSSIMINSQLKSFMPSQQ